MCACVYICMNIQMCVCVRACVRAFMHRAGGRIGGALVCQQAVGRTLLALPYSYLLTHSAVYSFIERASALEGLRQRRKYTFNYLDSKTIHLSGDFTFLGGPFLLYCFRAAQ